MMQGDKEDREKIRKLKDEEAERDRRRAQEDRRASEPLRLVRMGMTLEEVMEECSRQKLEVDRDFIKRMVEEREAKRAKGGDDDKPFYAVNTQVSICMPASGTSPCRRLRTGGG